MLDQLSNCHAKASHWTSKVEAAFGFVFWPHFSSTEWLSLTAVYYALHQLFLPYLLGLWDNGV